jgi:chorismate mutase
MTEGRESFYKLRRNALDPLDNEILERAFEATWEAIKDTHQQSNAESDDELEEALRRELIEIARLNGVSDPETLKDILLASMPSSRATQRQSPD